MWVTIFSTYNHLLPCDRGVKYWSHDHRWRLHDNWANSTDEDSKMATNSEEIVKTKNSSWVRTKVCDAGELRVTARVSFSAKKSLWLARVKYRFNTEKRWRVTRYILKRLSQWQQTQTEGTALPHFIISIIKVWMTSWRKNKPKNVQILMKHRPTQRFNLYHSKCKKLKTKQKSEIY